MGHDAVGRGDQSRAEDTVMEGPRHRADEGGGRPRTEPLVRA